MPLTALASHNNVPMPAVGHSQGQGAYFTTGISMQRVTTYLGVLICTLSIHQYHICTAHMHGGTQSGPVPTQCRIT